jgi:hypothetical protein
MKPYLLMVGNQNKAINLVASTYEKKPIGKICNLDIDLVDEYNKILNEKIDNNFKFYDLPEKKKEAIV